MPSETVLLTGASGFLGSYLAGACRQAGYGIVGVDLRLPENLGCWSGFAQSACDAVDFSLIFSKFQPRIVFHLAGGASVGSSVASPFDDFQSLMPGTVRLLESAGSAARKPSIVLFSSAAVYGNPSHLPISETCPIKPISPYGVHKAMAENVLEHYGRLFAIKTRVLRIFSAYGPGLRRQLIWDVCRKLVEPSGAVSDDGVLAEFYGTGEETRDFVHAEDIAQAALKVESHEGAPHEVFNVGSGVETSVRSIVEILTRKLKVARGYRFSQVSRSGDPLRWKADITKLESIGFRPSISIDTGLSGIAKWFSELAI